MEKRVTINKSGKEMGKKIYKKEEYQEKFTKDRTYLKCPKCGSLITSIRITIDKIESKAYFLCGKCAEEYIVTIKIIEFRDY